MNPCDLKRALTKVTIVVAFILLPAIASASQDTDVMNAGVSAATSALKSVGHVYVVSGDVFVTQGKNAAHRVTNNEVIFSNMRFNTGENSSALLKFDDGQVVTMQANTIFQVREYRYDANRIENSNIVFSMLKGGMRFVTGLIGKARKQAFRLAAPNATIGIRGTDFMVVMSGKSMYSQVLAGKITMTNAVGLKVVGSGQTAVVTSTSSLASLVPASAIPMGTFSELLTIPVDPAAIPVPAPVPIPVPAAPVPAPISEPEQVPVAESTKSVENTEIGTAAKSGTSLAGRISTLGLGAELNFGLSDSFAARIGINDGTFNHNTDVRSLNYSFDWQLQSISAIADWYPSQGSFRASGGILYNNNSNKYVVNPANGNYIINGTPYSSTLIASYSGTMAFNKIAPYIGIGWGNPAEKNKGWGFVTDIGYIYQGNPKSDVVVTCTTTCPTNLQSDATAENNYLQENSGYSWWPVVSIGISYQW